jgi:hypothetical protein
MLALIIPIIVFSCYTWIISCVTIYAINHSWKLFISRGKGFLYIQYCLLQILFIIAILEQIYPLFVWRFIQKGLMIIFIGLFAAKESIIYHMINKSVKPEPIIYMNSLTLMIISLVMLGMGILISSIVFPDVANMFIMCIFAIAWTMVTLYWYYLSITNDKNIPYPSFKNTATAMFTFAIIYIIVYALIIALHSYNKISDAEIISIWNAFAVTCIMTIYLFSALGSTKFRNNVTENDYSGVNLNLMKSDSVTVL